MTADDLRELPLSELFRLREAALQELKERQVAQTRTDPAGHLGELLVAAALWPVQEPAPRVRSWAQHYRASYYKDDLFGPAMLKSDHKVDLVVPWVDAVQVVPNLGPFSERRQVDREDADRAAHRAEPNIWITAREGNPGLKARRRLGTLDPRQLIPGWEFARIQVKVRTHADDAQYAIDPRTYRGEGSLAPVDLFALVAMDPHDPNLVVTARLVDSDWLFGGRPDPQRRPTWKDVRDWRVDEPNGVHDITWALRTVLRSAPGWPRL